MKDNVLVDKLIIKDYNKLVLTFTKDQTVSNKKHLFVYNPLLVKEDAHEQSLHEFDVTGNFYSTMGTSYSDSRHEYK